MHNIIKITNAMAREFRSKYDSSSEPIFKISMGKEVTHGCRVIEKTSRAVFVYVVSFSDCFGFWMPQETYASLNNGYINANARKVHFNNTTYRF